MQNWSDKQRRIYDGLSLMGEEIAGFYQTALKIIYDECKIENATSFLSHAAREIDGGLRDVLGADFLPAKGEREGHKKSIIYSLGIEELNEFGKQWHEIGQTLHKYAHRHGAWKSPRQLHEVPIYYNYFFLREKDLKWFHVLKERNYFSPEQEQGNANFWNILVYLERISEQVAQNPQYGVELLSIIEDIVQFSQNKKRINNFQIWWSCAKILNNLPNEIIKKHLPAERFRSWLSLWTDSSLGPITDIGEKLLPKFLGDDSTIAYAEAIIDAIAEIKPAERPDNLFNRQEADFVWDFYWIREAFQKNYPVIGQKCSLKIVFHLAGKLEKALEYKWKNNHANIEIGNEIYQISLSRIPTEGIKPTEIDFQKGQYECAVKQYSQEQLKNLETNKLDPFFNINPQIELKRFPLTAHNRNDLVSAIKQNLPSDVHWEKNKNLDICSMDFFRTIRICFFFIAGGKGYKKET